MKPYKSVEFCQFLQCQAPLHKRKALLLNTFWRRFWNAIWWTILEFCQINTI